MSGFLQPIARSFEVEANRTLTVTVRHSRAFLRHNICQATVSHTLRQPGNASTPTKTIKSVALLGSDCQSETIDYTDEGFICQARESKSHFSNKYCRKYSLMLAFHYE